MTEKLPYKFLLALLVFTSQPGFSQLERSYSFENYSNKEGFDQNTVWAIEQDKYGMFWLGTANGLIQYDGYSFEDVSLDPGYQADFLDERIWDIIRDEDGLLWILSRNSLNIYDHILDRFSKITPDTVVNFTNMKEDGPGTLWVFGNGYLASVSKESRTDTIITHWTPNIFPAVRHDPIHRILSQSGNYYLCNWLYAWTFGIHLGDQ
jgi:ligand-binding sensor domain-containing protein